MTLQGKTADVYPKLVVVLAGLMVGCGAKNASSSSDAGSCSSEIANLTPDRIHGYSGAQIAALGTNFRCLNDAALGALSGNSAGGNGQINAITAEQIAVLTPAQVRMLGATGDGGAITTSKIASLNTAAWAALASNMQQVAAITAGEIHTLSGDQLKAVGTNIKFLTDAALGALSGNSAGGNGLINAITAEQIAVLTPAQVRMLGATGDGGAITTSKIASLNTAAWAALASNMQQVAAITAGEIHTLSGDQLKAVGTNIKFLTDAALGALSGNSAGGNGQINAITAEQIAVLTPAQVRMLGATGDGGAVTTSKIASLNTAAWAALASNMQQVAAITAGEIHTLSGDQLKAVGTNIKFLTDAALGALSGNSAGGNGLINTITAEQIAVLTPAQVRMLGATGDGGAITTSKIASLNTAAWAALASNMQQVAAITAGEIHTLSGDQLKAVGTNIKFLTDAALGALSGNSAGGNGQINAITAEQIAVLTPAQVRMLGATGDGGAITTSKIASLNTAAWAALASNMQQVAAITAGEIHTLSGDQLKAVGTNIKFLTDAALGALSGNSAGGNGLINAITAEQVAELSPAQISIIAGIGNNTGIASLNMGAFASLSAAQIAVLTDAQKASLSPAQHASCGC